MGNTTTTKTRTFKTPKTTKIVKSKQKMGVLTVYLDKMMNLRDADWIGKSDPYVKFQVEQDNWVLDKDYGHQKSTVKRDTCNPQYGEVFTWTLPSLKNMVIHCKVMDKDPLVDDKLGYCKVKLEDLGLSEVPL